MGWFKHNQRPPPTFDVFHRLWIDFKQKIKYENTLGCLSYNMD